MNNNINQPQSGLTALSSFMNQSREAEGKKAQHVEDLFKRLENLGIAMVDRKQDPTPGIGLLSQIPGVKGLQGPVGAPGVDGRDFKVTLSEQEWQQWFGDIKEKEPAVEFELLPTYLKDKALEKLAPFENIVKPTGEHQKPEYDIKSQSAAKGSSRPVITAKFTYLPS